MSENSTEGTVETDASAQRQATDSATETPTLEALQAKLDELTKESRKWESRAKENGTKAREFDEQRRAAMSESERAVAEAEARGRTAAATEYGKRLARTEFDAIAGRRNPDFDTASALEFVDLSRFLGDDGEPDPKAIKAAVERLVPAAQAGPPSLDGGARNTANTADFNQVLRRAAGRA